MTMRSKRGAEEVEMIIHDWKDFEGFDDSESEGVPSGDGFFVNEDKRVWRAMNRLNSFSDEMALGFLELVSCYRTRASDGGRGL